MAGQSPVRTTQSKPGLRTTRPWGAATSTNTDFANATHSGQHIFWNRCSPRVARETPEWAISSRSGARARTASEREPSDANASVDRPLRTGLLTNAYRIVQEALSNAGRHSPGSNVVINIERDQLNAGSLARETDRQPGQNSQFVVSPPAPVIPVAVSALAVSEVELTTPEAR